MDMELLKSLLTGAFPDDAEMTYETVMTSTNRVLKEKAQAGAPAGSFAVCDVQTEGRGRMNRRWESESGQSLLLSVLLRPKLSPDKANLLTLAAAVALSHAMEALCPQLKAGIKWPNDLILSGRKCAGILCEMQVTDENHWFAVCGVGLNMLQREFPEELQTKAISLRMALQEDHSTAEPPTREMLLARFLWELWQSVSMVEQYGFAGIRDSYLSHSVTIGREVMVIDTSGTTRGVARDVDATGGLILQKPDGTTERILCGDASVRGVMGYC